MADQLKNKFKQSVWTVNMMLEDSELKTLVE
jgi:hypothetical protein